MSNEQFWAVLIIAVPVAVLLVLYGSLIVATWKERGDGE